MRHEQVRLTSTERNLGLQWVAANIVGWVVGFAVCEALKTIVTTVFVDGLVIGTAIGFAQWLVLRRGISSVGWWVGFSIIGFGLGKALSEAVAPATPTVLDYGLSGAVIGASVGLAQWLVLRQHVSAAGWWVPATILAWVAGWSLIGLAEKSAGLPTLGVYLVGAIGAAGAGIVTGAALLWLLRTRAA
jgi:hypothetical protein